MGTKQINKLNQYKKQQRNMPIVHLIPVEYIFIQWNFGQHRQIYTICSVHSATLPLLIFTTILGGR